MTGLAELRERVDRLEARVDDVHELASGTGKEVAEWRRTLRNHTEALNGMSEKIGLFQKRVDQRFEKVDQRFDRLEAKVDENFAKVDENFAKVERKFELLRQGQDRITELLTRHLDKPEEETRAGGTDE